MKWILPVLLAGLVSYDAVARSTALVSVESQYKRATLVVMGTVTEAGPEAFTISVSEVLKGDPDLSTATLKVGGESDDLPLDFTLETGDGYYAFLWFDGQGERWRPVSGGQGVYHVYQAGDISYLQNAYKQGFQVRSYGAYVNQDLLPNRIRESELRSALDRFARDAR